MIYSNCLDEDDECSIKESNNKRFNKKVFLFSDSLKTENVRGDFYINVLFIMKYI